MTKDGPRGALALKDLLEPARAFPDGEPIFFERLFQAVIGQDQVDVRFGDQRADERPQPRKVQVVARPARVPTRSVAIVKADVEIAPRLMTDVRAHRATMPSPNVTQSKGRGARKLIV